MEIIQEKVKTNQIGKTTTSQFVIEDVYNVPDHKADVGRVITSEGTIRIEEVQTVDSYLKVTGKLHFKLLYVTDTAQPGLASMEGALPFREMVYVEEGAEQEYQILVNRLHLNVGLIHSRKLEIKAVSEFSLHRETVKEEEIATGIDFAGRAYQRTQSAEILELCENKRDVYRIKEEIKLPGTKENMETMLWQEISLRSLDTKMANNHLQLSGELMVFCIYQSQEGKVQWIEQTVPFEGAISCEGATDGSYHHLYRTLQDVSVEMRMDEDGEMRCLGIEAVLEMRILTYKEEKRSVLEDVYSLDEKWNVKMRRVFLEELVMQNHSKCRISEQLKVPEVGNEILQICHSSGEIQVEKTEVLEGGIQIEGILHVKFLYVRENDQVPFTVWSGMIPFTYLLECENSTPDLNYDITYNVEQLAIELVGNGEVEVKAHLAFKSFVRRPVNLEMVEQIVSEPLDETELYEQPGIIGYIVKGEDNLWKLAKKYGTTEERIMEINELTAKELKTGDKLLIFKENMSIL